MHTLGKKAGEAQHGKDKVNAFDERQIKAF